MSEHAGMSPRLDAAIIDAQAGTIALLRAQAVVDRAEIERLRAGVVHLGQQGRDAVQRAEAAEATCVYLRNECEIRFNDLAAERAKNTELEEQLKAASDQASDGIAKTAEAQEACATLNKLKLVAQTEWGKAVDAQAAAEARTAKLTRYHEALLMTLRASNHYWIKGVYKNAAAAWDAAKASEEKA